MGTKTIQLLEGQQKALTRMLNFVNSPSKRVFILKGYAGTGKTTLMKVLIENLQKFNTSYFLLASTGRAAKILSNITHEENTRTIHSMIYHYAGFNQNLEKLVEMRNKAGIDKTGQLLLVFEKSEIKDTDRHLYIVDEASMVSDEAEKNPAQAMYGTGRLLYDLLHYDEHGQFIFVGDACQLPPVSQTNSPALTANYFKQIYHIDAECAELIEVVRQGKGNDIVVAAQRLRHLYFNPQPWIWAKFPLKGCKNIHLINNEIELVQCYIRDIKRNGYNNATLITQSNKSCCSLASIIRPSLGINSSTLAKDDLLLVTQNNLISGLMNGDLVKVVEIGKDIKRRAGLSFLYVSVEELFTHRIYSQLMIADILYSTQVNLSQEQQRELFVDFFIRMKEKGIKQNTEEFDFLMKGDPFLNALRCVYGYALTCHKSQGGEWNHVYLDIPRSFPKQPKPFVYQWVYTAMTRAKKELYVTNDFYIM